MSCSCCHTPGECRADRKGFSLDRICCLPNSLGLCQVKTQRRRGESTKVGVDPRAAQAPHAASDSAPRGTRGRAIPRTEILQLEGTPSPCPLAWVSPTTAPLIEHVKPHGLVVHPLILLAAPQFSTGTPPLPHRTVSWWDCASIPLARGGCGPPDTPAPGLRLLDRGGAGWLTPRGGPEPATASASTILPATLSLPFLGLHSPTPLPYFSQSLQGILFWCKSVGDSLSCLQLRNPGQFRAGLQEANGEVGRGSAT